MTALDTNVLVRAVTADEPHQAEIAKALLRESSLWLAKTVLLETEWVLRFTYKMRREAIFEVFEHILGYRQIEVEDRGTVTLALEWFAAGLDFADALHLASCPAGSRFATFDRELAMSGAGLADAPEIRWLR